MNPAERLDLTPLLHLGLKVVVVLVVVLVVVGLVRGWWENRRVAAPPRARGGAVEPIARVLRGSSADWDELFLTMGLFTKRSGQLVRPQIRAASQSELRIAPVPGSVPRWLHPATTAHLIQIANRPVRVGQFGSLVVIQVG